jgi:hypothetical protein
LIYETPPLNQLLLETPPAAPKAEGNKNKLTIIEVHHLLVLENVWAKFMAGAAGGLVVSLLVGYFFTK